MITNRKPLLLFVIEYTLLFAIKALLQLLFQQGVIYTLLGLGNSNNKVRLKLNTKYKVLKIR